MNVRQSTNSVVVAASRGLEWANARHPWSHNDHFHSWILNNLPSRRARAADIGCGQGGLVTKLAGHFDHVDGVDTDREMRETASRATGSVDNVSIRGVQLAHLHGPFDLITMVAALHHLDTDHALTEVQRLLAPGGKFMVVGLAPPVSTVDHAWDIASVVVNPLIGLWKHPRPVTNPDRTDPFPVKEPAVPLADLSAAFSRHMPGTRIRRRLCFRYTAEWTKPGTATGD